ncbi:flavin-containing monooxygenase [Methylobacterium organophilum]|uniref:Baeyer-Villiger monooxygenase n=1 Tax=Methylobacterium organophilum TaxID=410 RepID=A0ABQ4T842_METOR|nr:NAD(P)/FAD-dependent oxidoreductase [Methylobacterium organophilum]GJE27493.1 Baeyer-Villiger monooxygenase [Methylobacterium organophilum]
MSMPGPDDPLDLLIVGAGFSGLALAIRAERAGLRNFLILEKAGSVGGTWRDNTYPGAASDIPSHLYALSFAPKADWSRLYPRQPEIAAYLEGLVAAHGLGDRLRLSTPVGACRWDEAAGRWRVETPHGTLTARALVLAVGGLHEPALPALPGLDRFAGAAFHSARWDHGVPLDGKRVGVIGTGASAVQFVPEIADRVGHLVLFQRSAPWILPRWDRALAGWERALYARLPILRRLYRLALYGRQEAPALLGFTRLSRLTALAETLGRRHLQRAVSDARLRAKLTPDFRLGCKRVLLSDDYYPALARSGALVVQAPIREVRPGGVLAADDVEHQLDVLIFATGFEVAGSVARIAVTGRGGRSLTEAWSGGRDAFQGLAVHGFPNLFLLLGPNTGLAHNSVLLMMEAQLDHVLGALRHLRRHPRAALDVRPDAQARFRQAVDARMRDSIWLRGGCGSWYLDAAGRNRALWPGTVGAYRRAAARLRLRDYDTRPQAPTPAETNGADRSAS